MEIHQSFIFGTMCNLINFPENNPATRNSFSCGQSKQACSMYHTNHQVRMDKTGIVLNSGQNPLVRSRYLKHINHECTPYGENTIVAVMCYTGYNVEDAILVNEGAIKEVFLELLIIVHILLMKKIQKQVLQNNKSLLLTLKTIPL